jgi:methanogenic corrinoid protein MtbC1
MVVAGPSAEAFSCHDWEDARPRSRRAVREASPAALSRLTRTIEAEVIPRLMLSHGDGSLEALHGELDRGPPIGAEETREFARLILDHDVGVAASYIEVLRSRGASLEAVFLQLLAPSARLLGDLWKEDLCSFADVTVGLSRLQLLLRRLGSDRMDLAKGAPQGHSILLAAAPGEQHTFGILMVEESFRQAGWDVCGVGAAPVQEILQLVRRDSFDVIGFSATNDILSDQVGSAIEEIRRVSRNRNIRVLFGGRAVAESPETVLAVGADATAIDGRQAALMLPRLIGDRAGQRT